MKTFILSVFGIALLGLTGCSTTKKAAGTTPGTPLTTSTKPGPQTVMVIYHVQLGREAQLQSVIERAWSHYRSLKMVAAKPHVMVRETEEGGQSRFVEIFTWSTPPSNPPASVRAIWQEEFSLCEPRNGRNGLEGGVVELIIGK
jgi:hypothetical protein